MEHSMNVLVVDIGGTHVKVLATGHKVHREFDSGPTLTPKQVVAGVKKLVADWKYEAISIGYPGPVLRNRPLSEPWNLGKGWAGFDFEAAFKCPVRIVNDAAMQALGSYKGGKMLFLGLGTGLGSISFPFVWAAVRETKGKTLEQMKDTTNLSQALGSVEKNLGIAMHD